MIGLRLILPDLSMVDVLFVVEVVVLTVPFPLLVLVVCVVMTILVVV
jgi:hypothetical protein